MELGFFIFFGSFSLTYALCFFQRSFISLIHRPLQVFSKESERMGEKTSGAKGISGFCPSSRAFQKKFKLMSLRQGLR